VNTGLFSNCQTPKYITTKFRRIAFYSRIKQSSSGQKASPWDFDSRHGVFSSSSSPAITPLRYLRVQKGCMVLKSQKNKIRGKFFWKKIKSV
jgi:hypothetical protein